MVLPHAGAKFLARAFSEPLLISRHHIEALMFGASSPLAARSDVPFEQKPPEQKDPEYFIRLGNTAVITCFGPILKSPDWIDREWFGACDVDEIRLGAQLALMDDTIERVFLFVRSPGGTVTGIPEAAQALADLNAAKPLYGFTDTMACSAGYWLISKTRAIYMTPSARVGSIGVYSIYQDATGWLEQIGLKINAISVGSMKLAGAPFKPMTTEERAMFQASCDRIGAAFHEAVNVNRTLSEETMQGQVFDSETAIQAGLVDGVVWDFREALALTQKR